MTEEEVAIAAAAQSKTDSVFRSFDHWWNVTITEGPQCTVRDLCKAAFECGIETGEARAKIRASAGDANPR